MTDAPRPKILQFRFSSRKDSICVACSFGSSEVERNFPHGYIPSRIAAIFSDSGELIDIEIIVEPVTR